ncbi:Transthyretin-like family-containing protein [Strongyloides ratti]|uniref:Transthyretin-like family-containing protein n=1 Tax=Strongyloides ratti TaxID=34506 RepID=A0A090MY14_STRRB|nr:Transthyretin-like family-containing protein [Strongyloides ratti]CEF66389.1 Transthyretin-like family-containing protein [Strongyloides ratti]
MKIYFFTILPFLFVYVGSFGIGIQQSAGVKGTLLCNGKPYANVKVKLYDDDMGIDTDDFMSEGKSDSLGRFAVAGYAYEFGTIDPKINIYHDCNDEIMPCQRKITVFIPKKYVSKGETPESYYDAGNIELAGEFKGEERDCIH